MKKHIACASEFDYVGWKAWAEWRQEAYAYTPRNDGKKDCKNACAWPSECRWGKKHGVNIPTTQKTYEAYSPSSPSSAPKTDKPRSSLFLDRLIKSAEKKSAGRKALLSAVEEEEARSPTSPLKVPYELPDLQLPTLTSKSKDSENSSEDIRMSDAKGENSSYSAGSVSDDASALKQPTFSSDTTLTENEQIIEYASADINFDFASDNALASTWFTEKSPTSPGRRNAWDWSVEVPDNMALADNLACDEHVVWEGVNFFDVEML
ncbi:MAG: hypothetical protein M1830_005956 [Pleopsidium flavum]|nr:MAG: hypothetical protein M1830_005956 [Pleopsidium flavum]